MRKSFVTLFLTVLFLVVAGTANAGWQFSHLLYDFQLPQSNSWGIHGVAVDPNDNIWLALHGNLAEDTLFVGGDTVNTRPVYILDSNGNHVAFSPLRWIDFGDGRVDTLHAASAINGSGKGISTDRDGNILYTSWSTVYRINYTNGMGMNVFTPSDMSSMTEAVQDEANGFIYVGYVISAARPIYILNNDFNLIGNAVDTLGHITRTMAVTPDGKDLYVGSTWNGFGIEHFHSDIPGLLGYTAVDTLGNWDSVYVASEDTTYYDVKLWSSCLDWDPDGRLWAGNLRPDWSGPKGGMYYAFDIGTGELVDSVGVPLGDSSAGGVFSPRGMAFSNDGQKMYLADYDYNVVSVWTPDPSFIEEDGEVVARSFSLAQNYPNPFNPVTNIPFALYKRAKVTLKVFNVQGQEVATLINETMNAGNHNYTYDASHLASGVYYYSLDVNGKVLTKSMILVK